MNFKPISATEILEERKLFEEAYMTANSYAPFVRYNIFKGTVATGYLDKGIQAKFEGWCLAKGFLLS